MKNKELHFKLELYFEQFLNFAYGIYKIVSGVIGALILGTGMSLCMTELGAALVNA